ncbi:hypothetical protein GDO81_016046 [Engystomops pustulosus]|uniref:Alkylated DNA repair protein AlkB homologue 8 N-terminal domain-containing protein n=1 Tax=Engystomops pustulosus TaxID=76066 RepID=A0AAV7AVM6_ENGPU|nr:hypothetical protein GDO81_016046 [Engystomops pustulosus]
MDWLCGKAMTRLHLLRKLRSFQISTLILKIFYQTMMASGLFYAFVCWGGGLNSREKNRLNKVIQKDQSTFGETLHLLEEVWQTRCLRKFDTIAKNISHPLHDTTAATE